MIAKFGVIVDQLLTKLIDIFITPFFFRQLSHLHLRIFALDGFLYEVFVCITHILSKRERPQAQCNCACPGSNFVNRRRIHTPAFRQGLSK